MTPSIRRASEADFVKGYSIALLCLGLLLFLGALQFRFSGYGGDVASLMTFVSNVFCLLGVFCLTVALLRWMRASAALPATTALSFALLIAVPLGTALSIYWLTVVRSKERIPQDASKRIWFRYTVALYILGLMMLVAGLDFRFVLGTSEDPVLRAFEIGSFAVALVAIAIAVLRSYRLRLAHQATFVFNALIVLWPPLGTALALYWFLAVRKHEKVLLSTGHDEP